VKRHRRWRYILGVSLIAYGVLVWWQQGRATGIAAKEREDAIKETSARVTKDVTQVVGNQYQAIVSNLTDQIGVLKGQLAQQGEKTNRLAENATHGHINFPNLAATPPVSPMPLFPFRAGELPTFSVCYRVFGPVVVDGDFPLARISIEDRDTPITTINNSLEAFRKTVDFSKHTDNEFVPGDGPCNVFHTDAPLTTEQAKNLTTGASAVCAVGVGLWKDQTGGYETNLCQCFMLRGTTGPGWGEAGCNNKERKAH
jgi:hypothetical protein